MASKARHLLIPYCAFLVLLYVPSVYLHLHHTELGPAEIAKVTVWGLVGGRALTGWLGVFWFVTCLFIVQQLMNVLAVRFSMRWIGVFMLIFLVGAYANSILFPWAWLPWNANVVLMAAPVFYLGWLAKSERLEIPLALAVIGVLISICLLMVGIDSSLDMKYSMYGIPVLTLSSALCAIQLLIRISRWVSDIRVISSVLAALGESSMMIMYCHQPIQMIMRDYLSVSDPIVRFVAAIAIGFLIYKGALISRITKIVFLGGADRSALNSTSLTKA